MIRWLTRFRFLNTLERTSMCSDLIHLEELADTAVQNAYAPYSNFSVGAVIVSESGQTYSGCNVENISSGLTVCAERNAIANGIAKEGQNFKIKTVYVTNKNADGKTVHCSPCGACRQVIAEFATADTQIHYHGQNGLVTVTMDKLLPDSFTF